MENEIWKDIIGYEDYYEISSHGRVRSKDRTIINIFGKAIKRKGVIIHASGKRYLKVMLYINNVSKNKDVHRLVGLHFVDGYFEGAVLNHKDGNKRNNYYKNFEWTTVENNNIHAKENNLLRPPKSFEHGNSIDVLNLETGIFYGSLREASETLNINRSTLFDRIKGKSKIKTSFVQLKD